MILWDRFVGTGKSNWSFLDPFFQGKSDQHLESIPERNNLGYLGLGFEFLSRRRRFKARKTNQYTIFFSSALYFLTLVKLLKRFLRISCSLKEVFVSRITWDLNIADWCRFSLFVSLAASSSISSLSRFSSISFSFSSFSELLNLFYRIKKKKISNIMPKSGKNCSIGYQKSKLKKNIKFLLHFFIINQIESIEFQVFLFFQYHINPKWYCSASPSWGFHHLKISIFYIGHLHLQKFNDFLFFC